MHLRAITVTIGCALAACSGTPPPPANVAGSQSQSSNASAGGASPGTPDSSKSQIKRTLIVQHDFADMPGFESRMYLIEYPPGAQAGLHAHTQSCVGFVLEGSFESGFGDHPSTLVRAGEGFVDLARQPHRFRNANREKPLRFVVAGTFRKGEPIFETVPGTATFTSTPERVASGAGSSAELAASNESRATEVKRTLVAQSELADMPGMESRLYLIEFPPGAESKLHEHPVVGVGYVLDGSFESAFGDQAVIVKRAGDGFVDLPRVTHRFRNADASRALRFLVAGTFHKGDPLFTVKEPR